ncbi:MAG TPA: hypothetical protein VG317_08420 [Pseudonocardiaceae bacterium]|jgi:hypothetical protein|nr:hypothetical protein [Pseudonocardiaceae bacterium]
MGSGSMLRKALRRLLGRRVPAGVGGRPRREGGAGGVGVREPRRPKPKGPRGDSGAAPIPDPPVAATLPDPRQ